MLPSQPTPFIGRAEELAEIAALLADPACHLLTLVGPGGIGKTRLALEVASKVAAYSDGVYFIALQPLTSPDTIVSAIASAINFQFYSGGEPKQQLLNYLGKKHLLLLLDNFEHLLEGVDIVRDILAAAPAVQMIVTSRERLNLSSETIFTVGGLSIPNRELLENVLEFSAVKLFVQSARRIRPDFTIERGNLESLIQICRLVGGMPLAILLAAAWVDMLSLQQIVVEIQHNLEFLETRMRDLPERHRSARATFDYSWGRLPDEEREVFKKLSIFRGGFSREAAQVVAGASFRVLVSLVNKSFVQTVGNGRYDIHELLRQYGAAFLNASADESNPVKTLHAAYYAEYVNQQYLLSQGADMQEPLYAVGLDYENMRVAWDWLVQQSNWKDLWKLSHSFMDYAFHLNRSEDAFLPYAQAVAKLEAEGTDVELLGVLLAHQAYGSLMLAKDFDPHAYHLAHQILSGIAPTNPVIPQSLGLLGFYGAHKIDLSDGERLMRASIALCRAENYRFEQAEAITCLMVTFSNLNINQTMITELNAEATDLAEQLRNPLLMALVQRQQGQILFKEGRYAAAKPLLERGSRGFMECGDRLNALTCQSWLADIAYAEGDYDKSLQHNKFLLDFYNETTNLFHISSAFDGIAKNLVAQGKREQAAELCALTLSLAEIIIGSQPDVERILEQLQTELPPQVFAAAVNRGRARDLDATVQELLAALDLPVAVPEPQSLLDLLTRRELEILALVAAGRSNREIANTLFLAVGTVKWYITGIYSKLAVKGRLQAIARARKLNLLP